MKRLAPLGAGLVGALGPTDRLTTYRAVSVAPGTVPDISRRTGFVSGAPQMVRDAARTPRALGATSVKTDAFSGY